jgi:hypothetical protein
LGHFTSNLFETNNEFIEKNKKGIFGDYFKKDKFDSASSQSSLDEKNNIDEQKFINTLINSNSSNLKSNFANIDDLYVSD